MIVKETVDYVVLVAKTAFQADTPEILMYQIKNKGTEVVELETSVMPRAMRMIDELQRDLEAARVGMEVYELEEQEALEGKPGDTGPALPH